MPYRSGPSAVTIGGLPLPGLLCSTEKGVQGGACKGSVEFACSYVAFEFIEYVCVDQISFSTVGGIEVDWVDAGVLEQLGESVESRIRPAA